MKLIWAPWRSIYIKEISNKKDQKTCFLCKNRSDQNLCVIKGEHAFVMLNRYPYNPGHLLVA
ncbi:MAG: HIT family hydrolase, partial [candidate division WOR-3 bacterium]|nr:HIT family hydrolase [candidate division WOR-3 bacterium]MDW7987311.1 HIT family hydrolase [candidate division WOR-3 bacterium]